MIFVQQLIKAFIIALIVFLYLGFVDTNEIINSSNNKNEDKEILKSEEVIVSRVVDGDTIIVTNAEGKDERVRILNIDTPESVHPTEPEQKFGREASDFAKEYLEGQKVEIERGNPEKDKYGRTLAYIFVDGVNFNRLMLEEGYARIAYVNGSNTKYLDEFKQAENKAKKQKKNIWSIPGYVTDQGFDMSVVK